MTRDRHVRVYAWLARMLLPSGFHARVGHELVATFADRISDARSRRELGLRVALGAPRSSILSLVLADAARIGVIGVAIGTIAALLASRVLASIIWGVAPSDPVSFAAAGIALLAVTVIAATIPARRASRVEPMIVMRG